MTQSDLTQLAESKRRALTLIYNHRFDRNTAERKVAKIRAEIMQDVTGDKGENGKPLYSNEQARKAEASRREEAHVDLHGLQTTIERLEKELAEAEVDIQYFNDLIRIGTAFAAVPESVEA